AAGARARDEPDFARSGAADPHDRPGIDWEIRFNRISDTRKPGPLQLSGGPAWNRAHAPDPRPSVQHPSPDHGRPPVRRTGRKSRAAEVGTIFPARSPAAIPIAVHR